MTGDITPELEFLARVIGLYEATTHQRLSLGQIKAIQASQKIEDSLRELLDALEFTVAIAEDRDAHQP